ncbi:MAG TPA: pyruvate kinase [Alphaproteobacteria bacterium]|jgi:pyruvate kinase|nr:pyruvate kinase [Alphaproteobacteria bacterium]
MKRNRRAKIVATLGPASSSATMIEQLFLAGADVFRLNFSHGTHQDHQQRYQIIRDVEKKWNRPIGIMLDLQGPKLRVGQFVNSAVTLQQGQKFKLDLKTDLGSAERVNFPHADILAALKLGTDLLLDDGKIRLKVEELGKNEVTTTVVIGGKLSDRKGVNIPSLVLPLSALTKKDREDLSFGLDLGVDWVALSFVQRPEDVIEAAQIINGRAGIIVKIEKPSAVDRLDELVKLGQAVMVARGDLGVEMPPESIPAVQKKIIATCRRLGKPVIVATQMLESMIQAPAPTRAEASDVATAVYDGADAVMLSAESASGSYPTEAVAMMNRIIMYTEGDPLYRRIMDAQHFELEPTASDAITAAAAQVAHTISAAAIVTYTASGSTTLRAARERPEVPIICLPSDIRTSRRLSLLWGTHCVYHIEADTFGQVIEKASKIALQEGFAKPGQKLVVTAGVPFGTPGSTNTLRIAQV